jgi:hypothetical protein
MNFLKCKIAGIITYKKKEVKEKMTDYEMT